MNNDERDRERYRNDRGQDRWRDERDDFRSENRGMFGYEGEGYMGEAGRQPWREELPQYPDRFDAGEPRRDFDQDRWSEGRGSDVDRDREQAWRGRNSMPDRIDAGRTLARYTGRDSLDDRGVAHWRSGTGSTAGSGRMQQESSYRGVGPRGYRRSDERLHEEVCERLAWDHDVDASEIEVAVADGLVTLTGTVHDRRMKRRAEDVAESVQGVRDVQNHLHIDRGHRDDGRDAGMQSGVIGLASTENVQPSTRSDLATGQSAARGTAAGSAGMTMTSGAANSAPITNPGAVSTGSSTSGRVTPNQGITTGNTSAGDRARKRNR